ncbi:hypothetical protein DFH08DRAFT_809199 [Mycena albidolilacea]|uniref:Uncharacterized protein n=1 Tax=Mycena albidolilacea TaxID=1033008 RepID=A0AAD7A1C1_9AGAR|nr:hypothetical protein DFH08DRAFT_809199 [Mycena albidolilacea]
MFSAKFILTALAFAAISSAAPKAPKLTSASITVCTNKKLKGACVTLSVISDSCINFTGGLTFLNKEITSAQVPAGFVCTFFEDFGCEETGTKKHDAAALTGGTYNNFAKPGLGGVKGLSGQNFDKLTSSISCSPI